MARLCSTVRERLRLLTDEYFDTFEEYAAFLHLPTSTTTTVDLLKNALEFRRLMDAPVED